LRWQVALLPGPPSKKYAPVITYFFAFLGAPYSRVRP
jgi:hypothetical protein